jgi:hypothetical protein
MISQESIEIGFPLRYGLITITWQFEHKPTLGILLVYIRCLMISQRRVLDKVNEEKPCN